MSNIVQIQGTRYIFHLEEISSNNWKLALMIHNVEEDSTLLKNHNMRAIQESVDELIKKNHVNVNSFQVEMMIKELYAQSTGDTTLEQHKEAMKAIEDKREFVSDPQFKDSLVSEFKESFNIQQEVPKKKVEKTQNKKSKKAQSKKRRRKKAKQEIIEESQTEASKSGLGDVLSEIDKNIEESQQPQYSQEARSAGKLTQQYDPIDTRVTSVDMEDLIRELNETKDLLRMDLDRVYQRTEKIDKLILKISSISSRF